MTNDKAMRDLRFLAQKATLDFENPFLKDCETLIDSVPTRTGDEARLAYRLGKACAKIEMLEKALAIITDHATEVYPHFESERGQADINYALTALKFAGEK